MKNIFITWHYTTHGIAFLKHVLSAFYIKDVTIEYPNKELVYQQEMNAVFDNIEDGFRFDKIFYITADQHTFDKLSARRFNYRNKILEDI